MGQTQEAPRSGNVARPLWLLAAGLLLAPLLVTLLAALALAADHLVFTGDNATLEIRVLHALRGAQWVGAYSRYGWSHPGPLYFYLLAPVYAIAGRSTLSLSMAALAINSVTLVWLVSALCRSTRSAWGRGAVLVALGLFLLAFRATAVLIVTPLASIWSPDVAVLPFGALIVAAALLGSGRVELFPVVVFAHALVTQSHVGYVVPATVAAVVGLGWALADRRKQRQLSTSPAPVWERWLWSGLLLGALCWSLPVVDLVWGRGNLFDLFDFFLAGDRPMMTWLGALGYAVSRLSEPLLPLVDASTPGSGPWMTVRYSVAGLLTVGLASAVWRARRRRARFEHVFAAIVLLEFLVLLPVLAQLGPQDPPYVSEWVPMLSALAIIAIAMGWCTRPLKSARSALVAGVTASLLLAGLAIHVHRSTQRLPAASDRFAGLTTEIVGFADAVEAHLRAGVTPVLAADESALSTFAGVVDVLYKRGHAVALLDTPRVRNLLGRGFTYRASSRAWIVFSVSVRPDGELLARGGRIEVYRFDRDRDSEVPRRSAIDVDRRLEIRD